MEIVEHLFRRESARMVAVLAHVLGVHNLALAEDVVQDAFCRALEVWKFRGVPANPSAWLMTTAKNRAIDAIRRDATALRFAPELTQVLHSDAQVHAYVDQHFAQAAIKDDELRMMFSCCDPRLAKSTRIALILHISCGFGAREIAAAYLTSTAAVEKRIQRGKRVLCSRADLFDLTEADVSARLSAVQRAIYLLFNEGYHGAGSDAAVHVELCREAMRLCGHLRGHQKCDVPTTNALAALLCLNAARLPARVDASANLVALDHQNRNDWDQNLIAEGRRLLDTSATGAELSSYHIEAAIASVHFGAPGMPGTDWPLIISLYDLLMQVRPSAIVALNRAIAVGQLEGPERGLQEVRAVKTDKALEGYPFYAASLGEFELRSGRPSCAESHFRVAAALARNPAERRFFESRTTDCGKSAPQATTGVACSASRSDLRHPAVNE